MSRFHNIELCDLYRGKLSLRRLAVLVRKLPHDSALVIALTGQPQWNVNDLLADLWAVVVRANSPKDSLPADFDHPVRAEMAAKAKAEHKAALKAAYKQRKSARESRRA